jgi:hypothetical protein
VTISNLVNKWNLLICIYFLYNIVGTSMVTPMNMFIYVETVLVCSIQILSR